MRTEIRTELQDMRHNIQDMQEKMVTVENIPKIMRTEIRTELQEIRDNTQNIDQILANHEERLKKLDV